MIKVENSRLKVALIAISLIIILIGAYLLVSSTPQNEAQKYKMELVETSVSPNSTDQDNTPVDMKFLNVSETSVTIFFRTKKPISTYVQIGKNNILDRRLYDARDTDPQNLNKFYLHFFEFIDPSAEPGSEYVFRMIVNNVVYDNDGNLYKLKTAPLLSSPPNLSTIQGKVLGASELSDSILIMYSIDEENRPSNYIAVRPNLNLFTWIASLGSARSYDQKSYINSKKFNIILYIKEKTYRLNNLEIIQNQEYNLEI